MISGAAWVRPRLKAVRKAMAVAAALLVVLVAPPASANNKGTTDGNATAGCAVDWTARTVLDTDLRNDDPVYPGLMVMPDGTPVNGYSNGGYITDISPNRAGDAGMFEINHWYQGNEPAGPLVATAPTPVHWRIPLATDYSMTGAKLVVTLPAGTGFTFSSGRDIGGWGTPYSRYIWTNPAPTATPSADGLTWTVDLGDLGVREGVVLELDGTVPTGTVLSQHAVASAHLTGTYLSAVPGCPATSGNTSTACKVAWTTDATLTVVAPGATVSDVTRDKVVSPQLGDPGKLGIDGWTTVGSGPAVVHGRFVLATDKPLSDVTWVLHLDPDIATPSLTVSNPAPAWRVDGAYPQTVTIDSGVWDAAAHTMTYHLTMPAASSVLVSYEGDAAPGSYVADATYANTATVTGTYAPGDATCPAAAASGGADPTPSATPSAAAPAPSAPVPDLPPAPSASASGGSAASLPDTGNGVSMGLVGLGVALIGTGAVVSLLSRRRALTGGG